MTCHDYKDLMMGYLDNELSNEQRRQFEEHLTGCSECKAELKEFRKLKAITDEVTLVEPEDKIWQDYWSGIYNRIERRVGWIVFSAAAILLAIYGGFKLIEDIITDPSVGILLKAALLVLIAGLAILLVSVSRERLHIWQKDRYRNVRR
ncbi:MAG: zf-HC2 domain-containing protein [Planctomycetes bacterium]|nr:zf-HC2 domain-containing protein [Planctomycetota bacterium]MBL7144070.1 zf-HC2 domain-containing protein [Phycisphaerae bacterium]